MALSLLFSVMIGFGTGLVTLALVVWLLQHYRELQLAIIRRFSGRLQTEETQGRHAADPVTLRREQKLPLWARLMPGGAKAANLAAFSAEMRRMALVLTLALTLLIMLLLNRFIGTNLLIGGVSGLGLSLMIWYIWLGRRIRRRLDQISETVPEALDMIVRSLRVGLPIGSAVQSVGLELTGPLAEEFSEASRRISYGQQPVQALRDMADRCQNQNLRFFAAAVALQSVTGGNLAEVLERLCAIARGRQALLRKVRSITSEAKWSGSFLSFFPVLATVMLLAINPGYFNDISDKPFFMPMLAVVGTLLILNVLFMRWLVKIA